MATSDFGKAVARSFGNNTGQFLANAVYNGHNARPYRRVDPSLEDYRKARTRAVEARVEIEKQKAETERLRIANEARAESERIEMERMQALHSFDLSVREDVAKIINLPLPTTASGLNSFLSNMAIQMKMEKHHDKDEDEAADIKNKYFDAVVGKFEQALDELQTISPSEPRIKKYARTLANKKSEVKKQKNIKLLKRLWGYYGFLLLAAGFVIGLGYLSESEGELLFPISLRDKILLATGIIGVVLVLISVILWIIRIVSKKNAMSEYDVVDAIPINVVNPENQKTLDQAGNQNTQVEKSEPKDSNSSIFFDLNSNERIARRLSEIWSKYRGVVKPEYTDRRPIFAADGVDDCILFVGVNPSFDPTDDAYFIESEDKQSLLYGSLYQIADAPEYFRKLEEFSSQIGKAYAHMNLLYVRENDRAKLLKSDGNFLREQLELTYETIVQLYPRAIVFFTTYCRQLVLGKQKWVDPQTFNDGHFILNGTNIPVFFEEDVTAMSSEQQTILIERIKSVLK